MQLADWALNHPSQPTVIVIIRVMALRVHYMCAYPDQWTRDQARAVVFEDRSTAYDVARKSGGLMLLVDVADRPREVVS